MVGKLAGEVNTSDSPIGFVVRGRKTGRTLAAGDHGPVSRFRGFPLVCRVERAPTLCFLTLASHSNRLLCRLDFNIAIRLPGWRGRCKGVLVWTFETADRAGLRFAYCDLTRKKVILKHSHYQTLQVMRLRHGEDDGVILSLGATLDYRNGSTGIIGGLR